MKLSPRRAERLSLAALVLQVLLFFLTFGVAIWVNSPAVSVAGWHYLGGSVIWLILFIQFRQRRLADEERQDTEQYDRVKRQGTEASVFEGTAVEGSLHLAERRLAWVEKYLVWIFGILTAGYLLGVGYWQWRILRTLGPEPLAKHEVVLKAAALLVGFALVSFLFSRYASGMSRYPVWRPLRAGGSYLLSNALMNFAMAVVLLLADYQYASIERYAAHVIVWVMMVIGAEVVLNLVLDAYQPRIKGRYRRAGYESRLLGIFSEPGDLFKTFAHAVDYQFGFKVSETWFYRLLVRAIVPLVLIQALALYLMTSVTIVKPGNVGVLERFGEPVNKSEPWGSGLHVKLPWPMDVVRQFPVDQIQVIEFGFERGDAHDYAPILWTVKHWQQEYPFMVAVSRAGASGFGVKEAVAGASANRNDFDLLVMALVVHYRISDVSQYGYGQTCYLTPHELLESVCYREAVHYAAYSDIESLMGPGRYETTVKLRDAIQAKADAYQMGVKIVDVSLESVHPPVDVAESFEGVVSALQDKQGLVLRANGESNEVLARAKGDSDVRVSDARAYKARRADVTEATVGRFAKQQYAYSKGGSVYLWREYLSVLEEHLTKMRKYVIGSSQAKRWVYEVDLKEQLQPDLFTDLGLPQKSQTSQESQK